MTDKPGEAAGLALLFWVERAAALLWCVAVGAALADQRITRKLTLPANSGRAKSHGKDEPALTRAVTAIVPVRNEAANIDGWVADVSAQDSVIARIIIADDGSEDETLRNALAWKQRDDRVEVVPCAPPPHGWIGKSWAAHQAALRARSEWLLFSDADMRMRPGTVTAALRAARELDATAVSLTATLACGSFSEKIVMPVMAALIFNAYPICLIADDRFTTALMWGGFILVRRAAYWRVGGHAAVRSEIAEDRALARVLKAFGYRIHLLNGSGLVRVRMYSGLPALWEGWRKNLYEGVHRNPLGALAFIAITLAMLVVPAPLLLGLCLTALQRRLRHTERKLLGLAGIGCVGAVAVRLLRDPLSRSDIRSAVATPLAGAFIATLMAASAWRIISGAGQTWKGRTIH